jgi:sugar/nucleoside kinase (ribokinase family)
LAIPERFDVTVAGELNPDLILYGLPQTLAPEREYLVSGMTLTLGSSSAIFAHNLAALGSRVGFISRIGDDPLGQICMERLAAGGVDVSRVRRAGAQPGTGITVVLSSTGSRHILTYPGTMAEIDFEDLDLEYLAASRHFHLSSFFLLRALLPRMKDLFRGMQEAGLTTSLDINDDPEDKWDSGLGDVLRHVDVFFLNERELKKLSGKNDVSAAADAVSRSVSRVVVKLGASGALMRWRGEEWRNSAIPVSSTDFVGAGDSFDAGFIHQFVRGADPARCLAYGNLAGSFSTIRAGGTEAFRDRRLLDDFLSQHWMPGAVS